MALDTASIDLAETIPPAVPVITSGAGAVATAQAYAAAIADGAAERDRAGTVPWQELAAFDASGLLAITVPRTYHGPDLPATVLAEVIRTIAAVDPAIAQIPQGHFLMVDVLAVLGTPDQRHRLFAEVLAGGRLGNGMAERGGRHAQDLKTRLTRGPSGLRLNGRKYYCTGAISSRWLGITALDDDDRLVMVFVERAGPGVQLDEDWNVMGQRATVSGGVILQDVAVDPDLVVPYQAAFEGPQQFGARAQLIHTAIEVGIAGGALRDAGNFVRTKARPFFEAARTGWGEAASQDPHTIHRFGQLAVKVQAAEALLASAAGVLDEVTRTPRNAAAAARGSLAIAQAKAFGSEVAAEVASEMFSLSGASATDEKYDLSRHWRNARTHASHDPVAWKYHHIGNYLLNDILPPNHGQI
jgi:SfnB family sulfur acquisition oxidoreductase